MSTHPKLRIGIIGAGNIGGTLARRFAALGHDVAVANSAGLSLLPGWPPRRERKPSRSEKRPGAGMWSS